MPVPWSPPCFHFTRLLELLSAFATIVQMHRIGNARTSLTRFALAAAFCTVWVTFLPPVYGQQSSSSSAPVAEPEPTGWRRISFGGRVNGYPFNVLNNKDVNFNVTAANQAWAVSTVNNYLKIAVGPSLEIRLFRGFSFCGEFLYHRLNYTQTSQVTVDGNVTAIVEQTKATLWDIPMMIRWRGLAETGFLSHIYFAGGGAIRDVAHIHTNTQTTPPGGATTSSNVPTVPSAQKLPGIVGAVGMRFVDDFGIKLSPELRYTHWLGATFDSNSTRSRRDEIAVGIALTF